jgi:hypothetical protein
VTIRDWRFRRIALACLVAASLGTPALAQSEIPVPQPTPVAPPPHDRVALLMGKVRELVELDALPAALGKALAQGLAGTVAALRVGDARAAVQRLGAFERQTNALVAGGVLADAIGQALIQEAAATRAQIGQLAFAPGSARPQSWSLTGCPEPQACEYLVLHVDRRAVVRGERDGTAGRPFRAIGDALDRAAALDACGVEIRVADGIYAERVVLSRPTIIDGESRDGVLIIGSIVNNAGADLAVRDLTIADLTGPGAIVTDAPCATTDIRRVTVDRASGFGIYQRGGALTVLASVVRNTAAEAGSRLAGTGVYLTGGVQGSLGLVELSDHATSALVASGSETRVYATSIAVSRTGVNPFFADEASALGEVPAAVEARDGALLLMEFSSITRSALVGLRVRDGSRAHFRYGQVARTRNPDVTTANGVAMSDGSVFELTAFTLTRSAVTGLRVDSAFATATHGEVSWHSIGVLIHGMPAPGDPQYTLESAVSCLNADVEYAHNEVDLDAGFNLPLPCEGPDCLRPCRTVPFDCQWCGP